MAILEVSHIEKHFGRTNVLKDVSFSMEEGTALAIYAIFYVFILSMNYRNIIYTVVLDVQRKNIEKCN